MQVLDHVGEDDVFPGGGVVPVGDDGVVGVADEEDAAASEAEDVLEPPAEVLGVAGLAWKEGKCRNMHSGHVWPLMRPSSLTKNKATT